VSDDEAETEETAPATAGEGSEAGPDVEDADA
jgi:hypothetical protein